MINISNRRTIAFALTAGVFAVGAFIEACGGGSSGGNSGTPTGDGGGTTTTADGGGGVSTTPGTCASPTIPIVFSPMYSAYIPMSMAQTFQIPAVTGDGNAATWSLSDPNQANLEVQSFESGGVTTPGVMITIAGVGAGNNGAETTGTVTVIATEGTECGSATLTITQNDENDWSIGNARYNNGNNLHVVVPEGGAGHFAPPDGGFGEGGFTFPEGGFPEGGFGGGGFHLSDGGSPYETDGGTACTTCHGPTATNFRYTDVSHTPEQTGGFSDEDLQNIILHGIIPDGGYFDPAVIRTTCDAGTVLGPNMPQCGLNAYNEWQGFHQWTDITSDEIPGVICYLRALTPEAQNGSSNFGGGGHHHDGGGAPPPATDSGSGSTDSGTGSTGETDSGTGGD
jgi:hypothetical protein